VSDSCNISNGQRRRAAKNVTERAHPFRPSAQFVRLAHGTTMIIPQTRRLGPAFSSQDGLRPGTVSDVRCFCESPSGYKCAEKIRTVAVAVIPVGPVSPRQLRDCVHPTPWHLDTRAPVNCRVRAPGAKAEPIPKEERKKKTKTSKKKALRCMM
jgi:hypothetical protein